MSQRFADLTPQQALRRLREQDNIMGWALARLMIRMELDIGGQGWDQPPRLFVVYRQLAPPELGPGMDGFMLKASEIPLPRRDYDGRVLAVMLDYLAREIAAAQSDLSLDLPDNIMAWIMCFEGYGVIGHTLPPPGTSLKDVPGHIEVRNLFAVDLAGAEYMVVRERGTDDLRVAADDPEAKLGGRITEGLRALVEATTGPIAVAE